MIIGEIIWAIVPSGVTSTGYWAVMIIGITITSMFSGVGMAGTYKWIPQVNKDQAGIIGGFTGALGATGGFIWAWIFSGIANAMKKSSTYAYGVG